MIFYYPTKQIEFFRKDAIQKKMIFLLWRFYTKSKNPFINDYNSILNEELFSVISFFCMNSPL